jgi:SHS2 domain-containing protein
VITEPARIAAREAVLIHCEAPDDELLLADWLNALIYEMATRHMLFSRFSINLVPGQLSATAWGEPIAPEKHQPAVEVKGATYTALKVVHQADGHWLAQCVVDV